mmetsp:Transcript_4584/g.10260  ORF Transcript_4584/g.10260 Transcript_4584/m.10260 type:complete len:203 (-) Transcript_4584:891-1499(-)
MLHVMRAPQHDILCLAFHTLFVRVGVQAKNQTSRIWDFVAVLHGGHNGIQDRNCRKSVGISMERCDHKIISASIFCRNGQNVSIRHWHFDALREHGFHHIANLLSHALGEGFFAQKNDRVLISDNIQVFRRDNVEVATKLALARFINQRGRNFLESHDRRVNVLLFQYFKSVRNLLLVEILHDGSLEWLPHVRFCHCIHHRH